MCSCSKLIYFINHYCARILFPLLILIFLLQYYGSYYFFQNLPNESTITSRILYIIYTICFIFSLLSLIKAYITDPGKVTIDNQEMFLNLYNISRRAYRKRAEIYNIKHRMDVRPPDEGTHYGYSSDDEIIQKENKYSDKLLEACKQKYREEEMDFEVNKCIKCKVIRAKGVHHCSVCHACMYNQDHHCIWLNQCVAQFNAKFFLLFLFYCALMSLIGNIRNVYYLLYLNYNKILEFSTIKIIFMVYYAAFDVGFLLFPLNLLLDQYNGLYEGTTVYDFKNNKMLEIKTKMEILSEIFGENFGIWWFIPKNPGGFYTFKNRKIKSAVKDKME